MWQRCMVLAFSSALVVAGTGVAFAADAADSGAEARLSTYDTPGGETYFALSVAPHLAVQPVQAHELVVLFDTSASQSGLYRADGLLALQTILKGLGPADRVNIMAVDLKAAPMTAGFVTPGSEELAAGLKKLQQRAPLGATDMLAALQAGADSFRGEARVPRTVIYIGDGTSRASVVGTPEFKATMEQLAKQRISISSVAIGPMRDIQFLAVVANHTGGMLLVDGANFTGQQAGLAILQTLQSPVLWPVKTTFSAGFKEVLPTVMPPLRLDRDSVVIGMLGSRQEQEVKLTAELNGQTKEFSWRMKPTKSELDYGFLPRVVADVRADGGLMLPTVGSAGLAEIRRMVSVEAQNLAELGNQALAGGNAAGAKKFADAALKRNPGEAHATLVRDAAVKGKGKGGEAPLMLVNLQKADGPAAPPAAGAEGALLQDFVANEGQFLQSTQREKQVLTAVAKAEVENGLTEARNMMPTNPETARQRLKALLESVERAAELDAEVRAQLRDQIESALREAIRRQIEGENTQRTTQESKAAAIERERLIDTLARKQEKIKQLMDRFNALLDERRFREAEEQVGGQVRELDPNGTIGLQAQYFAGLGRSYDRFIKLRDQRWHNYVDTIYEVEKSAIPFPDDPPLVYPAAKVWEDLTNRRKKYAAFDLAKTNSSEQRIFTALNDITTIDFNETPLSEVVATLKEQHGIPIILNKKALEAASITDDTKITESLKGITLRSALRLILGPLNLTYVVRDEVLVITTKEDAEAKLVTKVYPVADLVLPIPASQGANPFSLGGFGGGANQGGQQGGQQGGFGGGQQQGGGVLAVEDKLSLTGKKSDTAVKPVVVEQPHVERPISAAVETPRLDVKPQAGQSLEEAWDAFFADRARDNDAQRFRTDAGVRGAVRDLMSEKKYDDSAAVIRAALRAGQPQPWMYEALGLALQAKQAPLDQVGDELERALMSAVDLGTSGDETLTVANYMARIGLEKRALKLFRELSRQNPSRVEPYAQALATALKINDLEATQWACLGVLRQAWSKDQAEVEAHAVRIATATLETLQREKRVEDAKKFSAALDAARVRDVYIRAEYNGDADVDLVIEEPSGSVCSYRNPRTTGGGVLLGETFGAKPGSGGHEAYVCPEGFTGEYKLLLRRVFGKVTAGIVTVDIYTHYGTKQETHLHKQIPVAEKNALVVFDLKNGRRSEPLEEAQIVNLAQAQADIGRAVVGHQLETAAQAGNAGIAFDASLQDAQAAGRGGRNGQNAGAVGFRPVIQTLPEGANLSVQVAVVSADRRYVRITCIPFFSTIGDVTTFNFVTGNVGNGNPPAN